MSYNCTLKSGTTLDKWTYRRFRLFAVVIFMISWGTSQAQDPQFSQFYANPLYLNPALAGNTDCGRVNLNYRNQWPALSNAYITLGASYDQYIMGINSGVGVLAMNDRQGDGALSRTGVALFYAYKLRVSEPIMISFGVQASYYQERLDWDKLIFASQIDPTTGNVDPSKKPLPPENTSINILDFAAGAVMTYYDKWFVGLAVHHLTEPQLSFYDNSDTRLPMKFTVHGGIAVNLNKGMLGESDGTDFILKPQIMYMQQEMFKQLNFGLYVSRDPITLGAWFRHNFQNPDAIVGLIGINIRNIRLGYSYDFTLSNIGGSSGGAHEFSFAWDFCIYKSEKRNRIRAIKSPKF